MEPVFPVHVVPIDPPCSRPHRASSACWCGPVITFRTLDGIPVVRHRTPPPPPVVKRERIEPATW
jgi:hypothetical protein